MHVQTESSTSDTIPATPIILLKVKSQRTINGCGDNGDSGGTLNIPFTPQSQSKPKSQNAAQLAGVKGNSLTVSADSVFTTLAFLSSSSLSQSLFRFVSQAPASALESHSLATAAFESHLPASRGKLRIDPSLGFISCHYNAKSNYFS